MYKCAVIAFLLIAFHLDAHADAATKPAPITLRLGHIGSPGSLYDATATEFAKRVNEKLHGKAIVTVFPNSVLGNDPQLLDKVMHGELDLCMPAPATAAISPVFSVFDVPYLVLTRAHVRASRKELIQMYFQPAADAKGLVVLGMWENGFRHITNNVRPIHTPHDLKGLKVRVPQGSRFLTALKSYGATPTEYPFGPPLFEALKNGTFDGQENPFTMIRSLRMDQVQQYLSLSYHTYMPVYLVGNKERIAALPPDVQAAVKTVAADLQDWSMSAGEKLDLELRAQLSRSMKINEVDTLAFLAASFPAYLQFAAEVPQGKALIRLLYDKTSLAAAIGHGWQ
jgi:tripartite ATP-independent transporter DctP family solute receptor